ncbi:MAG: rod shape-determining protein MreD [Alphaproteobacteria bacterium]|nr:rod shape-determining protein MreD [Alphaproteobacteria bacterium]MBU0859717.1 rod shape-determining protein MreD [Alphaproteobacteria bacterium]
MSRSFDFNAGSILVLLRLAVPQLLLLLLLILNLMALPVPYAGPVKPMLVMMAVYYWSIYRPTLLPPWLCFIVGLLMDILSGMPPGVNAFILVALQWLVQDQRRFLMGQPYVTIWAVFGLVMGGAALAEWVLLGLVLGWAALTPVLAAVLLSLFLFPFVTLLLVFTHRLLPVASRTYP